MNIAQHIAQQLQPLYPPSEAQAIAYAIVEHLTGWDRVALFTYPDRQPSDTQRTLLDEAVKRLQQAEPIQYIIGTTTFCGLTFRTDARALIPRPETAELVAWCLEHPGNEILDIGTGSGCIAIALAKQRTEAHVTAFDIQPEALELARENTILNNVSVRLMLQDILHPTWQPDTQFDIIVSNPPYITAKEKTLMHRNVVDHEPHTALFVTNEQPLIFYDAIADYASKHLKTTGKLFFEINQYYPTETKQLLEHKGFSNVTVRNDAFDNPRMIAAEKRF
ncbi:MAG: peptide chain release factor N(5)-glutamine methyltransferase [Bacteroidales bacterium]|nr:peptide chain release factor N(5)-glutamine methyltransferase [Bacteroidales bacterium]